MECRDITVVGVMPIAVENATIWKYCSGHVTVSQSTAITVSYLVDLSFSKSLSTCHLIARMAHPNPMFVER